MELSDYRRQIDAVDDALVRLFQQRMEIAAQIAAYKKAHGLPVLQSAREAEKLADVTAKAPEALQPYVRELFTLLMQQSRAWQEQL